MIHRIRVLTLCVCLPAVAGAGPAAFRLPKRPIPTTAPPEVRRHIERLYSASPVDRIRAADALGEMGPKATPAVPFLKDLLLDGTRVSVTTLYQKEGVNVFGRPTVGRIAADALWDVRPSDFFALLNERDPRLRRCAVESVAERGRGADAARVLLGAMKDRDAEVRKAAVWGLHHSAPSVVVLRALLKAADDPSAKVRMAAAYSLVYMQAADKDKTVTSLIRMLRSDIDNRCRAAAAWSLGKIKDKRAIEALRRAASDPDKHVRYFAATALSPTKDRRTEARVMLALWRDADKPKAKRRTSDPAGAGKRTNAGGAPRGTPNAPVTRQPTGSQLRLTGIMSGPNGKLAIINGRVVGVGGVVNGAKVAKIGSSRVELVRNGKRFAITR